MELHESLYALGQAQGRELFSDADSFRGALDDWLDEEAASTGDINLLVDAVRLGAFGSMSSMLDSGADSDRAIADAGARLARDRGSADVGGSMWALAVLGYANGRVSETQVRHYQAQHASRQVPPGTAVPPPAGAPTAVKPQSPVPPVTQRPAATPPSNPVWPSSGGNPTAVPGPPPPPVHQSFDPPAPGSPQPGFGAGGFPPPQGPQPAKSKKSPLLPILAGLVVLLVIVAGVVGVIALTGDDGEPSDDPTAGETDNPEDEGPDLSPEGITERYSSLAGSITSGTGATECKAAESLAAGEEEKIECTVDTGTLVLTTYTGDAEIEAARVKAVNLDEGHLTNQVDSGYFTLFDPTDAEDTSRPASLYWDSRAGAQSALLTAGNGADADALFTAWKATGPTVDEPLRIMSPDLQAYADRFGIRRCERIPTLYTGELEESQCVRNGKSVWVATFANEKDFRDYRALAKKLAKQDNYPVDSYWWDTADPGRLLEPAGQLVVDPGQAAAAAELDELLAGLAPPAVGVDPGVAEPVGAQERQHGLLHRGVEHGDPERAEGVGLAQRAGVHAVEVRVVGQRAARGAVAVDDDGVAVADLQEHHQVARDGGGQQGRAVGPQRVGRGAVLVQLDVAVGVGLAVVADLGVPRVDDRGGGRGDARLGRDRVGAEVGQHPAQLLDGAHRRQRGAGVAAEVEPVPVTVGDRDHRLVAVAPGEHGVLEREPVADVDRADRRARQRRPDPRARTGRLRHPSVLQIGSPIGLGGGVAVVPPPTTGRDATLLAALDAQTMYSTSCSGLSARSSGTSSSPMKRRSECMSASRPTPRARRTAVAPHRLLSSACRPSANVVPLLCVGRPSDTRMIAGG